MTYQALEYRKVLRNACCTHMRRKQTRMKCGTVRYDDAVIAVRSVVAVSIKHNIYHVRYLLRTVPDILSGEEHSKCERIEKIPRC